MEAANKLDDLTMPGTGFHRIQGNGKHLYSMRVSDKSCLIFEFDGEGFVSLNIQTYF
jgi:plasmid maintenance system killer protein